MLIKYVGPSTHRYWDEMAWTPENNHVLEVSDAETALHLLTHPPDDFRVSDDEPLVEVLPPELTALLPFAGITSLSDLAGANKATVTLAAKQLGYDEAFIAGCKARARELLKIQQAPEAAIASPEEESDDNHDG